MYVGKKWNRMGLNVQDGITRSGQSDCPEKEEKRNAGLTTCAHDKEDPDIIRGNGHTF